MKKPANTNCPARLQTLFSSVLFSSVLFLATFNCPAYGAEAESEADGAGPASIESSGEPAQSTVPSSDTKTDKETKPPTQPAAEEKPAQDFHAQTPEEIKDRLRIATGISLGIGAGPNSDFSSDYLGFFVAGQYTLSPFKVASLPVYWIATAKYASITGVDVKRSLDMIVQRFLVGGGAEVVRENSVFRPGLALNVGGLKASGSSIKSTQTSSTDYRPTLSLEPYARFQVAPKIWILAGADLPPILDYSWYGLNLGATFSF
jgi:hypothetical protein